MGAIKVVKSFPTPKFPIQIYVIRRSQFAHPAAPHIQREMAGESVSESALSWVVCHVLVNMPVSAPYPATDVNLWGSLEDFEESGEAMHSARTGM